MIVDKSTVPVGTADRVRARVAEVPAASDLAFRCGLEPEFQGASRGRRLHAPDRIVVGTIDPGSEDLLREVYARSNRNHMTRSS